MRAYGQFLWWVHGGPSNFNITSVKRRRMGFMEHNYCLEGCKETSTLLTGRIAGLIICLIFLFKQLKVLDSG